MEIDPEIAAMMGFGSFGVSKKRKFGADEAFTDAQPASGKAQEPQQVVSNANAVPVAGARSRPINTPVADTTRDDITLADGSTMSSQALRRGIRNERGDTAYFLPSFLEDPWAKLVAKQS
ncbi:hypothetical protein MBLNU13_g05749t2 [Cladosporium sp. NU13]